MRWGILDNLHINTLEQVNGPTTTSISNALTVVSVAATLCSATTTTAIVSTCTIQRNASWIVIRLDPFSSTSLTLSTILVAPFTVAAA